MTKAAQFLFDKRQIMADTKHFSNKQKFLVAEI